MIMKRIIAVFISLMLLLAVVSCSAQNKVDVSFTDKDGNVICSQSINVDKNNISASQLFSSVAAHNSIEIVQKDGMILSINGIESSDSSGWLFYINGDIAQVGVNDYIPAKNDKIEMRYADYSLAFGEFEADNSSEQAWQDENSLSYGKYESTLWYDPYEHLCFEIDSDKAVAYNKDQPEIKETYNYTKYEDYIEFEKENVTYKIGYNNEVLYYPSYKFSLDEIPEGNTFFVEGVVGGFDYHNFYGDGTLEFGVISPSGFFDPYCKGTYQRDGNFIRCNLEPEPYYDTATYCTFYIDTADKSVLTWIFEKVD